MADTELRQCEYFLIRIAPDPIRNEYLNIGVALYDPQGSFAAVRLISDYQRVRCLFPGFDVSDLNGLAEDLMQRLTAESPHWLSRQFLLDWAQECFAHALQLTPSNAVLTRDPAAELEELYRRYVAPPQASAADARLGPRRAVLHRLQQVFEQERLKEHLRRNLRVSDLIADRDPFRFDYYYKPNGTHHFIQALALGGSDAGIKELGFTAGRLHRLLPGDGLEITAVVDVAEADLRSEVVAIRSFHEEILLDAGIELVPIDQAHALAARVRQNLHLG